jgi:hypothetical protein
MKNKAVRVALLVWLCTVLSVAVFGFTYTYDTSTPDGATAPVSVLDDKIREVKQAVQERENVDHYWPLTGTQVSDAGAGKHRQVTFYGVLGAKPTLSAGEGAVYIKTVSGRSELFFEDSDGTEKQLTTNGKLNILAADIPNDTVGTTEIELENNAWLIASDAAGTGDVGLIKAGTDDTPVLGGNCKTFSTAAPSDDQHVSNKKYVDDQVATRAYGAPTTTNTVGAALSAITTYLAQCDGVFVAYGSSSSAFSIVGYTDSSNPPTTAVDGDANPVASAGFANVHIRVRSGQYVKVVVTGSAIMTYRWFPNGTGGLVAQ